MKTHLNYCSAERSSLKFKTRDVLRPHFFLTDSVGHDHEYFLFLSQVLNVKDWCYIPTIPCSHLFSLQKKPLLVSLHTQILHLMDYFPEVFLIAAMIWGQC